MPIIDWSQEPELLHAAMRHELIADEAMLTEAGVEQDEALIRALNVVIAYYSIPGTWREGSYDG